MRLLGSLGVLVLCACGGSAAPKIRIVNDLPRPVTLQYCAGQRCEGVEPLDLPAGQEHAYPLVHLDEGGSADEIRIVDGRDSYCLLVPTLAEDDDADYRITLSTYNDRCDV